ncbi:hypothetical protein D3C78_1091610 [compost metagenome]
MLLVTLYLYILCFAVLANYGHIAIKQQLILRNGRFGLVMVIKRIGIKRIALRLTIAVYRNR